LIRIEQNENGLYEFRKESFTGIHEVEKIFIKKNDMLRRAFQEICKQLNLQSSFLVVC
jgi:hypothetical protein